LFHKGDKGMYEKLRTHILPQLIDPNTKVMVAVSGGPDSMALCHILWRYVRENWQKEISLVLTHVHHGVRKESDAELLLVQQMAAMWEIPCLIHRFDAKGFAKITGQSFQEAAREWRYARWKEDMLREGCSLLATAHHLGDQAETILYRLLRGSGTAGLAGIYPIKDSIIRPLLTFTKADILNYCELESVPFALDCSNEDPIYVRNQIRLELIPELERNYNPRIQEALGRTGELLRWDEDYLAQQVEVFYQKYHFKDSHGAIGLSRKVFAEPPAILSRLLRRVATMVADEPRGLGYSYVAKIMDSLGKVGWMQDLPGMTIEITDEGIWFRESAVPIQQDEVLFLEIPMVIGRWSEIPNLNMDIGLLKEWSFAPEMGDFQGQGNNVAVFDHDRLSQQPTQLVCRSRCGGDKMWFQGVGHKSLKKIFQEEKISIKERNQMPLIACGAEILWIPGIRQSDLFRAGKECEKVYCVFKPKNGF
jgi:tRNA(Ile)-lysidine synthase